MKISDIGNKVIQDIRNFPLEARQSQDEGGPKTSWDEYKEQIQYEEYDSFEAFQDTIQSMVEDEVNVLSEEDSDSLYRSIHDISYPEGTAEKKKDIIESILSNIQEEAEIQEIEYEKPVIEYFLYRMEDLEIINEVLKKVGPEEYLVNAYSKATSKSGEQGVVNIEVLDDEYIVNRITKEEFDEIKASLYNTMTEAERMHKTVREIIKLRCRVEKKHPRQVLAEMKSELEERKVKKDLENEAKA